MKLIDFLFHFYYWMPPVLYGVFIGFLALIVVILILKVVAFILDVLPIF